MSLPAAVLWDLDGTLIDTEPYWIACEHELVASYGGQWTDADAKSVIGFDLLQAAEVIRSRGTVPLRPQEIVDRLLDGVIAKLRQNIPWRPGARELLASLRLHGVPCGLVTMSWKSLTDVIVPQLPPGSFQTIITGDMVMNGKPHPEPYRRAAEELHVDPLSCVAIEDSPTGIASAEAAGCVVVAVQNVVPIPAAPHRVMLNTLRGITPEHLGEWVESTPPPQHTTALETEPVALFEDAALERPAPQRRPDRATAALRLSRGGHAGLGALVAGRGRILGALAAVLVLVLGGIWYFAIRDTGPKYDPGAFNVHTWAPYWALEQSAPQLDSRVNQLHAISPFPFHARGVTLIDSDTEAGDDFEEFIDDAQGTGVPVIPTVVDSTDPGAMAAILGDATERAAHVDALARFAADGGYDGLDIDYENFAFEDDRSTWATTRPNWVTFITELGARLHADGRVLNVSVPWILDGGRSEESGYWVYDYAGIAPHVDAIRIMAYDRSFEAPGPIAPIDWVEDIIDAATDAAGGPEKLILGIPMYGRNWVIATEGECPDGTPDRQDVRLFRVDELIARRSATPTFDPVTAESSFRYTVGFPEGDPQCTQTREVHYVDAEGARQRMQLSIDKGMLGVSLFAFGYDDEAIWNGVAAINATLETTIPDGAATTVAPPTTAAAPTTTAAAPTTTTAAPTTTTAAPTTTVAPTTA